MTATALDISNHSGEITAAQFVKAKGRGVSRIIVALNDLPLAVRQIKAARSAGLEAQVYLYTYFARDPVSRMKVALAAIRGLGVRHVWIDCEDESHGMEGRFLPGRIRILAEVVRDAGYTAGIYTAAWWWRKWLPTVTEFRHLPLWDALWDRDPDIDPVSYGGWTRPAMSQHTADVVYQDTGIWCDINSYEITAAPPPEPEPTLDVPAVQRGLAELRSSAEETIANVEALEALLGGQ